MTARRLWALLAMVAAVACEPSSPTGSWCGTGLCDTNADCCPGLACRIGLGDVLPVCRGPWTPPPQTPVGSVTVTPDADSVEVGRAVLFKAIVLDTSGGLLSGAATWSSDDSAVAQPLPRRLVLTPLGSRAANNRPILGTGPGSVLISASAGEHADTATVRVFGEPTPYVAVATDGSTNCGIVATGAAYCWGQLVTGRDQSSLRPGSYAGVRVSYDVAFATVSVGGGVNFTFACGLAVDGAAYCWGWNDYGQLGTGDLRDRQFPTPVSGNLTFTTIGTGSHRACGLSDGSAYCWGAGALESSSLTPELVPGAPTFTSLTVGDGHTCGLTAAGAAYCWGDNWQGRLGDGTTTSSATPVAVAGDLTFNSLSAGAGYTCGVTTSGAAYCWGFNGDGQLGTGDTDSHPVPAPVAGGLVFLGVTAGSFHTCGVATSGATYCWGSNYHGQLGSGDFSDALTPVPVATTLTLSAVSLGSQHSCAIAATGGAYCWGRNSDWQVGVPQVGEDATSSDTATPVRVHGQP